MMGFEPTHIGITIRGLKPLDDTHHVETHWLLLVIVFNYLSVAVDQCVFTWCDQKDSNLPPLRS